MIGQGNLLKDSDNCLGAAVIQIRSLTFFFQLKSVKRLPKKLPMVKKAQKDNIVKLSYLG
jgi:hypothetical protein